MKGPEPLEIPSHFTVDWYKLQKLQKKTDVELAEELFISIMTLHKWKQRIGWKSGDGRIFCGRKRSPYTEQMKRLRSEGLSTREIAAALSISRETVRLHLNVYVGERVR